MGSEGAGVSCWSEEQPDMSPWSYAYLCLFLQYSTKEDKYEEEIKLLGEKLKEVRGAVSVSHWCRQEFAILCGFVCVFSLLSNGSSASW